MKKEYRIFIFIGIFLALSGISAVFVLQNRLDYAVVFGIAGVICLISLIIFICCNKDEAAAYRSNVKSILKCYDSILVKTNNIPDISDKDVITVPTMEELVNAQIEMKKPIYYWAEAECYTFMITTDYEALCYIAKKNQNVISNLERLDLQKKQQKKILAEKEKNKRVDTSILDGIDKTTIIKVVEDNKVFRVQPIRKTKEEKPKEVLELPKERKI